MPFTPLLPKLWMESCTFHWGCVMKPLGASQSTGACWGLLGLAALGLGWHSSPPSWGERAASLPQPIGIPLCDEHAGPGPGTAHPVADAVPQVCQELSSHTKIMKHCDFGHFHSSIFFMSSMNGMYSPPLSFGVRTACGQHVTLGRAALSLRAGSSSQCSALQHPPNISPVGGFSK